MSNVNASKKGFVLTIIGIITMILLILTKIIPSSQIAGYSVFVGVVFFFIVEVVSKTPGAESGLRFRTFFADIKKPGVLIWIFLPIMSAILTLVVGNLIFSEDFVTHVMGRTSLVLSFDTILLLIGQVIIAALGEEIAFRGFFVGKAMKKYPFWVCAVVSSLVFASAHIAEGNFGLVFFDIATIFIDSILYSIIFKKSGNCLISTISHILCNAVAIAASLIFF